MKATTAARNPTGIVKAKPIALRLMADELAEAEQVAVKSNSSKSALARQAYLLGLPRRLLRREYRTGLVIMSSPARRHFERAMAAQSRAAEEPANTQGATAYELMLLKLAEDKRRLKDVQSMERKADVKREILEEYMPWVEGVLSGDQGVQDDVLVTVMVWSIDAGYLEQALRIARYVIEHKLVMPDQYKRTPACLLAEEFADFALRNLASSSHAEDDQATMIAISQILTEVSVLTEGEDMPDEVRAKLHKAIGLMLSVSDKQVALDHLRRALTLHDKVGVKKDIEKLERELKNLASAPGGD